MARRKSTLRVVEQENYDDDVRQPLKNNQC